MGHWALGDPKEVANPSYPSCKPLELQLPRRTLEETNPVLGNHHLLMVRGILQFFLSQSHPKPGSR